MPRPLSLAAVLSFVAHSALAGDPDSGKTLIGGCQSYGMDFQGGGVYFQNVLSQDPFTFVQEFSGSTPSLKTPNLLTDIRTQAAKKTIRPTSWLIPRAIRLNALKRL